MKALNFICVLMFLVLSVSMVSAENIGIYEFNNSMEINNFCDLGTCTYMNLSSLEYPNGTIQYISSPMVKHDQVYTYSLIPDQVGTYSFITCSDPSVIDCEKNYFTVTLNGSPAPHGIVILGFIAIMLAIFMFMIVYLIRAVGLIVEASFDILDIAYAWGLFFGLLGVQLFANIYLGSLEVNNFLDMLVKILAFPMVIVPVVAFFLSLFRAKKKKKEKEAEW